MNKKLLNNQRNNRGKRNEIYAITRVNCIQTAFK